MSTANDVLQRPLSVTHRGMPSQRDLVSRIAGFAFLALCLEVLFSIPYRTIHLATHSAPKSWVAGLLGLLFCGAVYRSRERLAMVATRFAHAAPGWSRSPFVALIVGFLLRLLWLARFHPPLASDGGAYFNGAVELAVTHNYDGTYWPPGFSLFLAPFVAVLGPHQWVAFLCGFLLFAAALGLTYRLTLELGGSRSAAAVSSWVLALWPGSIAVVGINCKEALIACLLLLALLLLYRSAGQAGGRAWLMVLVVGLLVGCCALCQPGFTLFPAVILLSDWLRTRRLVWSALRTAVVICGMFAAILPWTYHNYRAHGRYILISSNGGSVFYTANNAHANASYSEESQQALPADPIAADKEGYRLGKQWVREHPLGFAVLSIRKQVVFLGDDGIGVYEAVRRNHLASGAVYNALKGVTTLYWFALWIVLLCCSGALLRSSRWVAWFSIAFLPLVYQWSIDSVFESASRHHMAYMGCLAALVALSLKSFLNPEVASDANGSMGTSESI